MGRLLLVLFARRPFLSQSLTVLAQSLALFFGQPALFLSKLTPELMPALHVFSFSV